MSLSCPRVRLIVVKPCSEKAIRFAGCLAGNSGLRCRVVERTGLPRFVYEEGYRPVGDPDKDAGKIFFAHHACYAEEIEKSEREGEFPLLVSDPHEDSAPFFVALRGNQPPSLKAVVWDRHLDCFGNRMDAGGHNRWLIDNGHLSAANLMVIGSRPIDSTYFQQVFTKYAPKAIDDPLSFPVEQYAENMVNLTFQEQGRGVVLQEEFDQLMLRYEDEIHHALEILWCNRVGVKVTNNVEALPEDGEVFLGLDTDVSWGEKFGQAAALRPYFLRMARARWRGMHVTEFDSKGCVFEMRQLAGQIGLALRERRE